MTAKNIKELSTMSNVFALYNPHSANNTGKEKADTLCAHYETAPTFIDITTITDYDKFFANIDASDAVVICGGDGTLNRFINAIYDLNVPNDIYYYATGNGNDFLRDFDREAGDAPLKINDEIKNLPAVTVKGKTYRFINGVGFGVDGYCCEVGDKLRLEGAKKINYTSIAIKGLLFHYKPTNAKVTVDGNTRTYKKTWIAPTMVGGYYGGGMRPAPLQDRNKRDTVSVTVMHGAGKLHTLMVFPSIFKGEHVKHKKMVDVRAGKHITVEFDRPVALQIDGETILGVEKYEVIA